MKLLMLLIALATIGLAFLLFRFLMRSPRTDHFFDLSRREDEAEDADSILARRKAANRDLRARKESLAREQRTIKSEINKIDKNEH